MVVMRRVSIALICFLVLSLGQGLSCAGYMPAFGDSIYFPDLEGHWAQNEIMALAESGVVSGYPDGFFYPDKRISMGETLKIVAKAKGIKVEDLSGKHWAYPYYLALAQENFLPWDYFDPEAQPSRGEIAELLGRAFYPEIETLSDPSFKDVPPEHPFFRSIEILHQLGIILGREDGNFYPEEAITRAEVAVVVCRILGVEKVSVSQETPYGSIGLTCEPYRVPQGGFLRIKITHPVKLQVKLFYGSQGVEIGKGGIALVPIPLEEETGVKDLSLIAYLNEFQAQLELRILVTLNAVPSETIELPPEGIELLAPELLAKEREEVYAALAYSSDQIPDLPFALPLESPILSSFGAERIYPGWGSDSHWGVDIEGKEGAEVKAAGKGTVVLAKELYSRGNTLIIDHGSGLFTLYYHLSAFKVSPGDQVEKGTVIGLVGATGAVTGPHLHWEARIGKVPVNPILTLKKGGTL